MFVYEILSEKNKAYKYKAVCPRIKINKNDLINIEKYNLIKQ